MSDLTANQQRVHDVLTTSAQRQADIGRAAGLPTSQTSAALYALAAKGLATGPLHGWALAAADEAAA